MASNRVTTVTTGFQIPQPVPKLHANKINRRQDSTCSIGASARIWVVYTQCPIELTPDEASLNSKRVRRIPWTGDQPVARPLLTKTQNKRTQTYLLLEGFEPKAPVFERAKTVNALERAATVIGPNIFRIIKSNIMRWARQASFIWDTRNAYKFWLETLMGRNHFDMLVVGKKLLLKWMLNIKGEEVNLIHLAQDGDQWRIFLNTI
jgi:hypothetical protein